MVQIVALFFITSILLVEVNGKKSKEPQETPQTVIILTTAGITAKMHKDNGLVRFPRGDGKSGSPISIEVKGLSTSHKGENGSEKTVVDSISTLSKGFNPSYGNVIPPYGSLEYLYGNHFIHPGYTRRHAFGRLNSDKSDAPESTHSNELNTFMGYYDHHHYHYNGERIRANQGGVSPSSGEAHHEPPIGDRLHGLNNFHGHHHNPNGNGGGFGHGQNNNNQNNVPSLGYFQGHHSPEGVVRFQSGSSQGNGHGGHSYSFGDGYHFQFGNDDRGNGYYYHSQNNPQENFHNINSNGPHNQLGFHGQSNNFGSPGGFRLPEGFPQSDHHGNGQGNNFHGGSHSHFDRGNNERRPSEFGRPHSDVRSHNGPNFRPHGHNSDFGQQQEGIHNFNNNGNHFGHHDISAEFPQHRNVDYDLERRHNSLTANNFQVTLTNPSEIDYIRNARLQNPLYLSANSNVDPLHSPGITVHNNEFFPSEQEINQYRYGEPGSRGQHLNRRQYHRPVNTSGDYGHRVYYGNSHLGLSGRELLESPFGYAKRFGYSLLKSQSALS